jgi:hypothetical protein
MISEVSHPLRIVSRSEFSRPRGISHVHRSKEDWQPVGDVVSGILRSLSRPDEMPVTKPSKQSA